MKGRCLSGALGLRLGLTLALLWLLGGPGAGLPVVRAGGERRTEKQERQE